MRDLVHAEWIKFRSVRSTIVTLLLAGALVVLVAVLSATMAEGETSTCVPADPAAVEGNVDSAFDGDDLCGPGSEEVTTPLPTNLTGLTGGVTFATLLFGVLGVQVIGQEYRFNTIRPTFTAAPRRYRVIAAKVIVVSLACAAIAALMVAFCWVVGTTLASNFQVDGTDRRVAWGIVLFTALWSTAGVAVGAIVRQPIAGILVMVGYSLIIENLIGGLFESTQRWLPFQNGLQMTLRLEDSVGQLQSALSGGLYFAAVCFALLAIGATLVNRRDA
jgi:ABC-2 type transport system permease protein